MAARRLKVLIPKDRRLVVEVPEDVPAGPAEILLVTPPIGDTEPLPAGDEDQARFVALSKELSADPRPFRELSADERRARLAKIAGSGRGLFSTSDEFARAKQEEIDLEQQRDAPLRRQRSELPVALPAEGRALPALNNAELQRVLDEEEAPSDAEE